MKKKLLSLFLCAMLLASAATLSGCAVKTSATDLMADIKAASVSDTPADVGFIQNQMRLSLSLFQASVAESPAKNVLISPLSIQLALAMTANGAVGQTGSEMESLLGGGMPQDTLNAYLRTYTGNLPSRNTSKLEIANSIWFRDIDGLTVEKDFLQTNADFYDAQVYKAPFDGQTVSDINHWVKTHTDGMIDSILDEISEDAMLYLINALVFDARWDEVYTLDSVRESTFTGLSGKAQDVDMMYSEESKYLDDGKATGFIKDYSGGDYSFVALLPNEGVDLYDYIAGLTPDDLLDALSSVQTHAVFAATPKFSCEYELRMNDVLAALGMPTAFGDQADFSKMGHSLYGNLFIEEVLHKTFLSVDELGTKAGAVTMVEMNAEGAIVERHVVILDRPFVYMILDNATNLPIFIGTVTEL